MNRPNILIVDDNIVDRKLLCKLFKRKGCRVQFAISGIEALEICKTQAFSLIVMDIEMSGMDGKRTSREIRQLKNQNKNQPIIGITSHEDDSERLECLDAGMNDYYQKPIKLSHINYIMEDWLLREQTTYAVS